MNSIVNIAYPIDSSVWTNCYVSILSLLENTNRFVNIKLVGKQLNEEIKNKFEDLENKYKKHCKIEIQEFDTNLLKKYNIPEFENANSWSRIILPEIYTDIDKMIIMSGSASIFNSDVGNLFDLEMNNNILLAAINIINESQNRSIIYNSNDSQQARFSIDLLLINCKNYRENDVISKFSKFFNNSFNLNKNNVKNVINEVLCDSIGILNPKYAYQEAWFTQNNINKEYIKSKEYKIAKKEPQVICYVGQSPQCSNCKHSMKDLWWKYAKMAPFEIEEIQSYKLAATSAQNSFKYAWLLSRIWPYIKPYWFRILLGFAIAIPLGLLDGVTAFALKPYMDYVVGGKAFAYSWHGLNLSISSLQMAFIIPAGVILFAIIQGVLRYLNGYLSTWTSQRITNDVKFDLFERLIHMHPQFFDDNSSGIVISRYMGDPGTASAGIVDQIKTITTSLFGALGLIAVMIYSSWKLAFVGVLVLCIAFLPVALIRKRIKDASNKNMVIGGKITTNINETYSGNKVMAAYGLQDRQNNYFKEQTWNSFNINMSLYKRAGWMSPMMYLIASIGIAIVLGYGTYLINTGHMTAGSFASFVTSLLLLYKPVKTLGNTLTGIQNIFVAMGRVFELFDLEPKIKDSANAVELKGFDKEIKFEDVCFEYIPNQPVLKNINLTIPKNETLAIVGNSGGGKSTLVNLLPRFYDIKSGAITIDGKDIKDFTIKSLRQNISMVFQDNFLYTGTIKDNIMMGNPDATTEELMSAIKSAHLEDMIQELPEGLETELGERGLTLSGGQRQRVAIARAMLRNAPIVILDEATSALDNESEAIVQKAMDNLMKNKTVFVIAHRLSTIKNANRIAVINEGELVELGTHEELMSIENGEYKHLYEMQFRTQEV